jgi:putative glutamine amidotransferase
MTNGSYPGSPVIGISCYALRARWGVWDDQALLLPRRYADKIAQAGGVPVLLPPLPGSADVLDRLDGLVLSGGADVDPARYGAERDPATDPASADRDDAELALCTAALTSGLPLLGICRGMQVINVALGGTLHQHLPDLVGHDGHSPDPGSYGSHDVTVAPGTRLAAVLGRTELSVPTHHHQAVDKLGAGLVPAAWADDGIIEAVEFGAFGADSPVLLAVQWHPEAGDDPSLFNGFVAAAQSESEQRRQRQPAPA